MAPIGNDAPIHIAVLAITEAAGKALTVTVTELDFIHPFELVSVTVYVVETTGDAVGLEEVEVKPDGTLTHEYVLPPTAVAPIDKEAPIQIAVFAITEAAGKVLTVTVTELDFTHPFELVSVRV